MVSSDSTTILSKLPMAIGKELLSKSCLVCADINERDMALDSILLPRSCRFFAFQVIQGSLVAAVSHFFDL